MELCDKKINAILPGFGIFLKCLWEFIFLYAPVFSYSSPLLHNEFIYKWTTQGRQFRDACDYVHSVADDVITKRKHTLVIKTA